jgi:hypothetical protein
MSEKILFNIGRIKQSLILQAVKAINRPRA